MRTTLAISLALCALACDGGGGAEDGGAPPRDAGTDAGGEVGPAHCLHVDLILAAIDPGVSITLFNPTADAIAVDEYNHVLCRFPTYLPLDDLAPGVTIPAGGSHTLAWPDRGGFGEDDDSGGELALYNFASFENPGAQIDFVCWGAGLTGGRKDIAELDGDWSGDCAPAITGEALVRVPGTDGRSAGSYDPTGAAAPLSCP